MGKKDKSINEGTRNGVKNKKKATKVDSRCQPYKKSYSLDTGI